MIYVEMNSTNLSSSLSLFETQQLGTLTRDGELFDICAGLSQVQVTELKSKSLDELDTEIQNNTSDRARFGLGSYEAWYGKRRTPFALVHRGSGALAALAWFGPKSLGKKSLKHLDERERSEEYTLEDTDWHTIVYRAYIPFRGGGLMKPFVSTVTRAYRSNHPGAMLWAGIHSENPASLRLCESLGFVLDEAHTDRAAHHYVLTLSA